MHRIRLSVRENTLPSPDLITPVHYEKALANGCGWVVESDSRVVGFAFGLSTGNVWALFVDPSYEGRGYGSALHGVLVAWLEQHAQQPIWLSTSLNTRAEAFYRARGWQDCGIVASGERRFEWAKP
mgnify:FL=1